VGPFEREGLREHLRRETSEELSVERLLETVVDRVDIDERDDVAWIGLTKKVEAGTR
jgi:hypothetical protein